MKLSWATWFQQLVAQLGYWPKVHIQGNKISFGSKIVSHGHYLTTSVTSFHFFLLGSREICLIILLLTKTGSEFELCNFKAGLPEMPFGLPWSGWATEHEFLNDTLQPTVKQTSSAHHRCDFGNRLQPNRKLGKIPSSLHIWFKSNRPFKHIFLDKEGNQFPRTWYTSIRIG